MPGFCGSVRCVLSVACLVVDTLASLWFDCMVYGYRIRVGVLGRLILWIDFGVLGCRLFAIAWLSNFTCCLVSVVLVYSRWRLGVLVCGLRCCGVLFACVARCKLVCWMITCCACY